LDFAEFFEKTRNFRAGGVHKHLNKNSADLDFSELFKDVWPTFYLN